MLQGKWTRGKSNKGEPFNCLISWNAKRWYHDHCPLPNWFIHIVPQEKYASPYINSSLGLRLWPRINWDIWPPEVLSVISVTKMKKVQEKKPRMHPLLAERIVKISVSLTIFSAIYSFKNNTLPRIRLAMHKSFCWKCTTFQKFFPRFHLNDILMNKRQR